MSESTKALPEDVRKKFEISCRRREYASKAHKSAFVTGATFGYNSRNEEVERLKELAPEWIGVNDRLPIVAGDYWCLCGDKQYQLFYAETGKRFYFDFPIKSYFENWTEQVTHWMPLPSNPNL